MTAATNRAGRAGPGGPLLLVAGLTIRNAAGQALVEDVSFSMSAGDRTGLLGESGSGKSLTSLAVIGLLPPGLTATGTVELGGVDMIKASERQRGTVRGKVAATVFQEPLTALDPLMRAGKQIAEPLRRIRGLRGTALRDAVHAALEEVRLTDTDRIARAYPHELSGGQRQRIAIARAIVCHPRVLLADEPVSALDLTTRVRVVDLLASLCAERDLTVLLVSHDLGVVAELCAHTAVLEHGRLVEQGDTRAVLGAPTHPYTRRLLASVPRLPSA